MKINGKMLHKRYEKIKRTLILTLSATFDKNWRE